MSKIIIFSTGIVKEQLIGPEIRVWEFAKNLYKKGHDVTLAVPNSDFPHGMPFRLAQYTDKNLRTFTCDKDVAVVQGDVYNKFITFAERIPTVCDLYDPYIIECLHLNPTSFPSARETLKTQLLTGDFFLCASEAQRLFYLGMLIMLGRLSASTFYEHSQFENIIDLVPFGASEENLTFQGNKNFHKDTIVFLGGVYNWYDPFTSIDCLKIILKKKKDIKFLFIKFPYDLPSIKTMEKEVLTYAKKNGVVDNIIFNDWVSYEERSNLYADIDMALVLHKATLEANLSFRTRIIDLLSFGIPVITNKGGDLENLIKDYECGLIVKENNPEEIVDSIFLLIENQKRREEIILRGKSLIRQKFLWEKVIEPLEKFCRRPSFYNISDSNTFITDIKYESIIRESDSICKTSKLRNFIQKVFKLSK